MWKLLYKLASPYYFYEQSARWVSWCLALSVLFIGLGLMWGLFFAPSDYQQGDAFRIIYVHVPCAFLSIGIYVYLGFLALLLLVWRIKMAGIMLRVGAEIGASMSLLALLTGAIWGKPMWGAWWVWDARLTSELILFFLYVSIVVLARAYENQSSSDRLVAILTLVGVADLPIIHYSVYWWNTLHQGATITVFSKPKIDVLMLYPLLVTLVGFGLFCAAIWLKKERHLLLWRSRRQLWVQALVERGL